MTEHKQITPSVVALAGRRIDAQDADELRFPLTEAQHVARKLLRRFRWERVERLVCSAACGSDILALEAAEQLDIPSKIVLPFAPHIFRKMSVVDRPGNWGERFDRVILTARGKGNLIELGLDSADINAFSTTNDQILQIARGLTTLRQLAFVVWEGKSRGHNDSTYEFLRMAIQYGFEKRSVLTMAKANER